MDGGVRVPQSESKGGAGDGGPEIVGAARDVGIDQPAPHVELRVVGADPAEVGLDPGEDGEAVLDGAIDREVVIAAVEARRLEVSSYAIDEEGYGIRHQVVRVVEAVSSIENVVVAVLELVVVHQSRRSPDRIAVLGEVAAA